MVPEDRQLFPLLNVEENLSIVGQIARDGPWSLANVFDLFPILKERRNQVSISLSGGQQQMVAIGLSVIIQNALLETYPADPQQMSAGALETATGASRLIFGFEAVIIGWLGKRCMLVANVELSDVVIIRQPLYKRAGLSGRGCGQKARPVFRPETLLLPT